MNADIHIETKHKATGQNPSLFIFAIKEKTVLVNGYQSNKQPMKWYFRTTVFYTRFFQMYQHLNLIKYDIKAHKKALVESNWA